MRTIRLVSHWYLDSLRDGQLPVQAYSLLTYENTFTSTSLAVTQTQARLVAAGISVLVDRMRECLP